MPDDASTPAKALPPARFGEGFVMDAWYVAALSPDLRPGKMEHRELLAEPVLLGRTRQGQAYAIRDICPHRAAALSAGKVRTEANGAQSIECPYHGWRFGTDGACTAIPSLTADSDLDISKVRVRRYPIVEQQGLVWIWMSSDARFDGEPPEAPPVIRALSAASPS